MVPSWYLGESGLLTARWLAQPDQNIAKRFPIRLSKIRITRRLKALWGAPGTMTAALFLYENSNSEQQVDWKKLYQTSVESLWKSWFKDSEEDIWIWEQDMYGAKHGFVGAGHGGTGTY